MLQVLNVSDILNHLMTYRDISECLFGSWRDCCSNHADTGVPGPTPSRNFFGQKAIEIFGDTFHKLLTTELWLKLVGLLIINIIGNA